MGRLGEAYVRVRADLKDFDADLDKELKKSADKFEKVLNASLGRRAGKDVSAGFSAEFDANLKESTKAFADSFEKTGRSAGRRAGKAGGDGFTGDFLDIFKIGAQSIGGLITDGLSGLPPQVRGIIGGTVLAASVPLIAGLTSIITAGTAAAVVGVGIGLASQFDVVQDAATSFGRNLREDLVEVSRPFIDPILNAFEQLDVFVGSISGRLDNTFTNAAQFVQPLTNAFTALLDYVTFGIDDLVANSGGLVDALAEGFIFLGSAIEQSLIILGDLGEDGETAIRDMLFAIADILVFTVKFLAATTKLYGSIRDLAQATSFLGIAAKILFPPLALLKLGFDDVDASTGDAKDALNEYEVVTHKFIRGEKAAVVATDEQTRALEAQARAIDATRDAQFRAIDSTLSYLDSLSNLTKTLKENKGAFNFQSEAGRESIRAVGRAFQEAEDRAKDLYAAGKLNSEQAQQLYEQEREEIYRNATAQGVNKAAIDAVYGSISDVLNLPPIDDKFKLLAGGISAAQEAARELRKEIARGGFTPPSVGIGDAASVPGYASGGIVDTQQLAMIGEGNRREVVLPLTNPRRTRELAQQSGLMNVLGGDGASTVIVMIGNEQLDSRMYRVANRNSRDQARMMTQGPRLN